MSENQVSENQSGENKNPHEEFEKAFSKNHAGYVLITCDEPSESGEMKVAMTYGGSPTLANMLIDGAQTLLDEQSDSEDEVPSLELIKS